MLRYQAYGILFLAPRPLPPPILMTNQNHGQHASWIYYQLMLIMITNLITAKPQCKLSTTQQVPKSLLATCPVFPCQSLSSNILSASSKTVFLRATAARPTAVAHLSHHNSVCPSVTRVDQSKTVQAMTTESSPSAAWMTLVLGTLKLYPERGC